MYEKKKLIKQKSLPWKTNFYYDEEKVSEALYVFVFCIYSRNGTPFLEY